MSQIVLTNGLYESVMLSVETPGVPWVDHRRMCFDNLDEAFKFASSLKHLTGWEIVDQVDSLQVLDGALQNLVAVFHKMGIRP